MPRSAPQASALPPITFQPVRVLPLKRGSKPFGTTSSARTTRGAPRIRESRKQHRRIIVRSPSGTDGPGNSIPVQENDSLGAASQLASKESRQDVTTNQFRDDAVIPVLAVRHDDIPRFPFYRRRDKAIKPRIAPTVPDKITLVCVVYLPPQRP